MKQIMTPVPNARNLFATPDGRIWRMKNGALIERAFDRDRNGYLRVRFSDGSKQIRKMVHRLVYETFCGDLINGLVVCHLDGNNQNNCASNLAQVTQSENISHKVGHGTHQIGERHGRSTITTEQARQIKGLLSAEIRPNGSLRHGSGKRIAQQMSVSVYVVYSIRNGGSWRHAN